MLDIPIHNQQEGEMATQAEMSVPELESLARSGFTSEEMGTLFRLQQWYQTKGNELLALVRHWEFLKYLVLTGKLDV